MDDQIDQQDNQVDPRIVARKLAILERFRPVEANEFISTGRARWAENTALLAVLGQHAEVDEHLATPDTDSLSFQDFSLDLPEDSTLQATGTEDSSDFAEIDMGKSPLPGQVFSDNRPSVDSQVGTIEFTLEDLGDNK